MVNYILYNIRKICFWFIKPWYLKKRSCYFLFQKFVRGWDDSETWNLDRSLAKIILPRLKRFKEISICVPLDLSEKEWNIILDKMIMSFEFIASEKYYNSSPDEYKNVQEGLDLFAKYYFNLWW